jgi:hypothetical protein
MKILKQTDGIRQRDTIELLLGASAILLFGVALVMWPRFGYFIGDIADWGLNLIKGPRG